MKIKSCYTLKEFLRPIHIEKFLSYIEKIYGNVLDDIEVKKSDKEKTLEFPSETCRSAKAEDLLLKDLATVPTQGYQCNQYQSAY